jgi:hypothetical protein
MAGMLLLLFLLSIRLPQGQRWKVAGGLTPDAAGCLPASGDHLGLPGALGAAVEVVGMLLLVDKLPALVVFADRLPLSVSVLPGCGFLPG